MVHAMMCQRNVNESSFRRSKDNQMKISRVYNEMGEKVYFWRLCTCQFTIITSDGTITRRLQRKGRKDVNKIPVFSDVHF